MRRSSTACVDARCAGKRVPAFLSNPFIFAGCGQIADSIAEGIGSIQRLPRYALPLLAIGLAGALPPIVQAAGPEPAGWYSGDMHVHRSCGSSPVTVSSIYNTMVSQDLSVVSLLADMGNGEVQNPATDLPLVTGQDASVSTAGRIVHWDAEWHWDAIYTQYPHQALGGHIVALGLTNASQIWNEMTYPIFDWARRQGGIAGFAHFQYLDDSFPQTLTCCTPVEYPVEVALGACDFISEDVNGSDSFIRAYYRLLNCGFRPGFAAGSDHPCAASIGQMLTYSQCAGGQLTYRNWLQGIKNGRTVLARNGRIEFVDLKVNTTNGPGDEIKLTGGGNVQVSVQWTATQTLSGTLELVRNGAVIASQSGTAASGAPVTLNTTVGFTNSGWLCARRLGSNGRTVHTAAVFVTVDQKPVRASAADAQFYVQWMDTLLQNTSPGGNWNSYFGTSLSAAQARYSAARSLYQQIATEAGALQPAAVMIGNGNDGAFADYIWSGGAWINAGRFQASSNMTVATLRAKVTAIAGHYKCAIYSDSGGSPSTFLRGTAEISNPADGWQSFPLTSSLALTSGSFYWLAVWSDDANAEVYYSGTSGTLRYGQYTYGAWPSPIVTTGGGSLNYCIYATGPTASLTAIAVTPANPAILTGASQQFTATGTYSDGSTQNITSQAIWSSSSSSVATINAGGLASGVSAGTATISAAVGTITGSTALTVQTGPLSISTTSLPNATANLAYSASLTAVGGTTPYNWSILSGTLPPGLSLNSSSGAIAGTPTAAGTYTCTAQVADSATPAQTAARSLSISVLSTVTIWSSATIPSLVDGGPDSSVELGVKFRSDVSGNVTGIRFYKASGNTGAHVGNLWTSGGALLRSAAFTGETASGWQQVLFATPVPLTANTIYVASYHANSGHYSQDLNYFSTTGVDNPPLHALANGVSGGNGVYAYGASSIFPNQTFSSANYWVDVVFQAGAGPTLTGIAVAPTSATIAVGATQQFAATGTYSDGSTQNLTSQATWTSSNTAVATVNASGLAAGLSAGTATISAVLSGVNGSSTLTVQAAPVTITTTVLPGGTVGAVYTAALAASGGTPPYTWAPVSGSLPPGLTLNTTSGAISGTPTAAGTFNFTVQVSDAGNPVQTASKTLSITVAPTLTSIAVTPVSPTFVAGATQQFTATGTYSDGSSQNVTSQATWVSSNTVVVSVSAGGLATGLSAGTTTIAAVLAGISGGTTVIILSPPEGVGDYRSAGSGVWTGATTWQTNNGTTWVAASRPPTNSSVAGVVTVRGGHTVTVASAVTVDQVRVEAGGQLTVNNVALTVANGTGTDLDVFGAVVLSGTSGAISPSSGATIAFKSGAGYQHARSAGTIPTATWDTNSTCLVTGSTSALPGGLGQTFGHFTWNCASQSSHLSLEASIAGIAGNLAVSATGTRTLRIANGTTARSLTVGGDFIQTGGSVVVVGSSGAGTLNVSRNFGLSGGTFTLKQNSGTANLNVAGNLSQSGGIFDLRAASTSTTGTVTVSGNFGLSSGTFDLSGVGAVGTLIVLGDFSHTGGTLTETSSGSGSINFNGTRPQSYSSGGIVANTVNFTVNSGATLMLGTSLLGNGSVGTFTLSAGGTLGIGDPAGITTSGATGNIRVTGTRTYNTGANYIYHGTVPQVPGNGLPATVNNLTIANPAGLTLNSVNAVSGVCAVNPGARLLGTGLINNGPLILSGTVAPGAGVGRFTTAREIWNGGAGYTWELSNATGAPATGWDLLSLANGQGIDLQSATTNPFTLKLITLNGSSPGLAANFDKTITYSWTIAIATNATVTNFAANKFVLDATQFSNDFGGGTFSVEQSGEVLRLKFTAAPSGLTIATTSLPNGSQNLPYAATLTANGGVTPYTWSITGGSLPAGLTLNAASGAIAGTPVVVGVFNFTAGVSDSSNSVQTVTKSLSITVVPALTSIAVTPANPTNVIGSTRQFTATGTYSDGTTQNVTSQATWASSSTTVATINSSGLATGVTVGITTISATLGGVNGTTTLTIRPPPLAITTTSLPNGTVSTTYTATLAASGGTAPYTWSLAGGALPTGLALNSTGVISGTPTTTGTSSFNVRATDAGNPAQTATNLLSITINPAGTPGIIGNPTEGTLTDYLWYNGAWINAGRFQAASNMTVSAMQAKVVAITGKYKCAIYSDSGSQPSRLLRSSAEVSNPSTGWQTFPLSSSLVLTNGQYYWLAIWSDNANAQVYYSGGGGTLRWQQVNYGNWPDPMATTGGGNFNYCIYATGLGPVFLSVADVNPDAGASGVTLGAPVTVTFNGSMDASTINTNTILLRDAASTLVPATVSYNSATTTATLTPSGLLKVATAFTATVRGGANGVANLAGGKLSTDFIWTFRTDMYGDGPGGPILILTQPTNAFSRYYAEILLTEGLNAFALTNVSSISSAALANYDVVILGQTALTPSQVTMLNDWVNGGGKLIAMRPDKQLAGLLGLSDAGSTLAEGYLLVNTASGPGAGIVGQTIQFHGTADRYSLGTATSLATLYSAAQTSTVNPAVTLRSVGSNGGQAAAFTFDLARSVVYTRQGNPAWADQNRDAAVTSDAVVRSDDLFYGAASSDPKPDWVDLSKLAIPQADEQQRLLANMILSMNSNRKLLPRFWYFPHGHVAVVVMTGDDHGSPGVTAARFDQYLAASPSGGSVDDWETVRSASYLFPSASLTAAQATSYNAAGFEIGVHLNTGCANYTWSALDGFFADQMSQFRTKYPSLPSPTTHRMHCIAWSGYTVLPEVGLLYGIRLDTSYYFYPPTWVANRPGLFTGSGMAMRFAATNGNIIDAYQAATQMTDESGQSYPYTMDTLLDRALGPEGYYGAFVANMHNDSNPSAGSDAILSSAISRGVPIVSARQLLTWLDARNSSSIKSINWNNGSQTFSVEASAAAKGLQVMSPIPAAYNVSEVRFNGSPIAYSLTVIKGIRYVFAPAVTGNYQVSYIQDTTAPSITSTVPANGATSVSRAAEVRVTFSEAMDPSTINTNTILLLNSVGSSVAATVSYDPSTLTAVLRPNSSLGALQAYTAGVEGGGTGVKDFAGNARANDFAWTFTTAN